MKTFRRLIPYFLFTTLAIAFLLTAAFAATTSTDTTSAPAKKKKKKRTSKSTAPAGTAAKPATANKSAAPTKTSTSKTAVATKVSVVTTGTTSSARTTTAAKRRIRKYYNPWDEPTYKDSTEGDSVDGEDLEVRRAAVEALGPYNGSIVVVDPNTGRILTMVNQRLALGGGFQPCSTIKVSVALAALHEGIVKQNTLVRLTSRYHMDLTEALAHSNNYYFANLGVKLGYEKVSFYAHEFGYGEKAGLNIEGEHPGYFPPAPPANGGMGMLTSFGEEIASSWAKPGPAARAPRARPTSAGSDPSTNPARASLWSSCS
jgi:membrane carboxypeptidase/penicillin-binding protein